MITIAKLMHLNLSQLREEMHLFLAWLWTMIYFSLFLKSFYYSENSPVFENNLSLHWLCFKMYTCLIEYQMSVTHESVLQFQIDFIYCLNSKHLQIFWSAWRIFNHRSFFKWHALSNICFTVMVGRWMNSSCATSFILM